MDSRERLVRALLRLLLVAAVASAPVFLVAERFDLDHVLRVAASNGVVAVGCLLLGRQLKAGKVERVARVLVFGLLALVVALAWTNGEPIHANVVNFVLVTLLASVLLGRSGLRVVAPIAAGAMAAIAWRGAVAPPGEELLEARIETIAQFLPSYAVIAAILWLREAPSAAAAGSATTPSARSP